MAQIQRIFQLANHDFCPQANQYVYWLKQPIGWVIAAIIFSLLVGLLVGPQGYELAAAFTALLLLGLAWPWLSMKAIHCDLILPAVQMTENESGEIIFHIRNYWPIPVFGMIVEGDFLQDIDSTEDPIAYSFKRIPAFSQTDFTVKITPRRRGSLPSGEVKFSNGFPFGLANVSKDVNIVSQTTVWPSCKSLDADTRADGSLYSLVGSLSDRSGNDGETIGVRCYREGDQLRNIHWAQTVRSQGLMVRERQTPSSTMATVVLDLSPDHHEGVGIDSSFEWAIRIASSICLQLHRSHSTIRLVCTGLSVNDRRPITNHQNIETVMNFLASLPTLEMQHEAALLNVRTGDGHWGQSSQTFFVGTSRSQVFRRKHSGFHTVVIELSGFEPEIETAFANRTARNQRPSGFMVTAPQLLASQLEFAWRRSLGSAAG